MNYKQVVDATSDLARLAPDADAGTIARVCEQWLQTAEGYGVALMVVETRLRHAVWRMEDVVDEDFVAAFEAFSACAKNYCELLDVRL